MRDMLPDLSRNQRRVADFLLSHPDDLAFLTAAELARNCDTSEASIIRLAKRLGYRGYPQFQDQVRSLVRQKLGPGQKLRRTRPIPHAMDSILEEVSELAVANLRTTRRLLQPDALAKAVEMVIGAKDKYVIGLRGTAGTARTIGFILGQLQPKVAALVEGGPVLMESLITIGPADLLLAVSLPRYASSTIDALCYARERGAPTIAITDSALAPAAQIADVTLLVQSDALYSNSHVSVMFVLDALAAAILSRAPDVAHARLEATEHAFEGLNFFFGAQDRTETA